MLLILHFVYPVNIVVQFLINMGIVCMKNSVYPSGFTLNLQETRSIHDSMDRPTIEFITYIYILYYQSSINFYLTWLVFQIF